MGIGMSEESKTTDSIKLLYFIEQWSGNSRDGKAQDVDGFHFLKMTPEGDILEAYEAYETEDGVNVVTKVPEMCGVNWLKDLGYQDFDDLESIREEDFEVVFQAALEKRDSTNLPS